MYFSPTLSPNETIPTRAGATFKLSQWVYAPTSNTGTNKVGVYIYCTDSTGTNAAQWVGDDYTIPTEGTWYLHEAYLTVPSGRDTIRLYLCSVRTGAQSQDVFYFDDIAAYEVTEAINAVDGVVNAVDGTSVVGSKPTKVKEKLQEAWSSIWHGLNKDGTITSNNKTPGNIYTVAHAARTQADKGVLDSSTAQGAADQAKSVAKSNINSGSNLVSNPGFENSNFYFYASEGAAINTADAAYIRNGSKSCKLTISSTSAIRASYFLTDNDSVAYVPCSDGDVFYVEAWVKGSSTNTANTGFIYLSAHLRSGNSAAITDSWLAYNEMGGTTNYVAPASCKAPSGTTRSTDWVKLYGYITIPAGVYEFTPTLFVSSSVYTGMTAAQVFYVDDVTVREITAANTAQTSAATAQATVDLRGKDFTNLAAGSDFEGASQPWALGTGWTLTSDQKKTGSNSIKRVGSASVVGTYSATLNLTPQVKEAEQFYIEYWVRRDATFNGTAGNSKFRVGYNSANTYIDARSFDSTTLTTANTWTQVTFTITVPAGATFLNFTIGADNTAGSVWLDDIIVRRVVKAETVGTLPQDKVTGLPETTANASTAKTLATNSYGTGGNLVPNASFEDTDIYQGRNGVYTDPATEAIARTGTRSLKLVGNGSFPYAYLLNTTTAEYGTPAVVGDTFTFSVWVRGKATNVEATRASGIRLGFVCFNAAGTQLAQQGLKDFSSGTSVFSTSAWTQITATLAVPAAATTTATIKPYIQLLSMPSTETYYFDDAFFADYSGTQTVVDNLHWSVNGGTTTTNAVTTVKDNLQKAWSNFWWGLNKSGAVGSLDKYPSDVFNVALTTRTNADQGILDAGSANSVAVTARSAAASVIGSGSNLVADPGFENSNFYFYASEGWSLQTTDAAYIRNGSKSAKVTTNGTANRACYFLTDTDSIAYVPCTPNDVFYLEAWVKGSNANTATTGSIYLSARVNKGNSSAPTVAYVNASTSVTPAQVKATANTTRATDWVKLSAYITIPADGYEWTPILIVNANVATGQVFYADDVIVREVTHAAATNQALYGTDTAGSAIAKDKVSGLPADLGVLAVKNKDPLNLVSGSDFEDATNPWVLGTMDWISLVTSSASEFANSGSKSLKITPPATAQGTVYYVSSTHFFEAKPGEQFYMECKVRKSSTYTNSDVTNPRIRLIRGNGANNGQTITQISLTTANITVADQWVTLSATATIPSDATACTQIYFGITGPTVGTMTGSLWVDDIIVRRVATPDAIASGLPQSKMLGASGTGTITGDITTAKNLAKGSLGSGANLVSNPGFELTTFYESAYLDTTVKRSGSRSCKFTANSSSQLVHLLCDDAGSLTIPATPGDDFYVEFYARFGGTSPTAGTFYLQAQAYDAAGAAITSGNGGQPMVTANATALTGSFVKFSGHLEMPANTAKVAFYVGVSSALTTGTNVFFDDVVVKEVTSSVAINNTLFGQKDVGSSILDGAIPLLGRRKFHNSDLSNLMQDPGFENGTTGIYNGTYTIATVTAGSVDGIGGTKVLQLASTGAIVDVNLEPYGIDVRPGEEYYIEYYVRKTTTGTTGGVGVGTSMGLNGTSWVSYPSAYTTMASLTQNTWTKVSATITVPAGANFMAIRASIRNDVPTGQTVQFDNIVVRKESDQVNSNIAQWLTGGNPDATGAAGAVAGLKNIFTELGKAWTAINSLQTSKSSSVVKTGFWEVDFADFNGSSVTGSSGSIAGFNLTYSGAGTSTIGVSNGVCQWTVNDTASRDAKMVYGTATSTDYQTIRGTMSAPPQAPSGTTPYFYAIARSDSSGNSYVFARAYAVSFGNYKADMGYVLNGVETLWVTGVALTWSLNMKFVAGVGNNVRSYQVWSGTTLVKEWDESFVNGASGTANESRSLMQGDWLVSRGAATAGTFTLTYDGATTGSIAYNASAATVKSALGALNKGTFYVNATSNGWYINPPDTTKALTGTGSLTGGTLTLTQQTGVRRWGAIPQVRNGKFAGKVEYASATDTPPTTVNGSTARMVRTSTTQITSAGNNVVTALDSSFFDSIPYESFDIDAVTSGGYFKVTTGKTYSISARVSVSTSYSATTSLILQKSTNGTTWTTAQYGPDWYPANGQALSASWLQYLNAGEYVRLAYVRSGVNVLNAYTGESTGAQTYFTIAACEATE
ncbi:MAG: hypothetical protein ACKODT_07305 [Fluviibacter sp.]